MKINNLIPLFNSFNSGIFANARVSGADSDKTANRENSRKIEKTSVIKLSKPEDTDKSGMKEFIRSTRTMKKQIDLLREQIVRVKANPKLKKEQQDEKIKLIEAEIADIEKQIALAEAEMLQKILEKKEDEKKKAESTENELEKTDTVTISKEGMESLIQADMSLKSARGLEVHKANYEAQRTRNTQEMNYDSGRGLVDSKKAELDAKLKTAVSALGKNIAERQGDAVESAKNLNKFEANAAKNRKTPTERALEKQEEAAEEDQKTEKNDKTELI